MSGRQPCPLAMEYVDAHLQREGSMAARLELLLDLYAPMTEQIDGTMKRDPAEGIISREDFVRLLDYAEGTDA